MTRRQLLKRIQFRFPSLHEDDVRRIVDVFFATITNSLRQGRRVEIRGFGSFNVKIRPPRQARNPRSGETIMTSLSALVSFKPGKRLHETLNPHLAESAANENEAA